MTNKSIGKYGEEIAKNFLIENGYKILEMNYHYSKVAEIDIIAVKDNIIHFVEVKTRTQNKFGTPFEAIDFKKLNSIFTCASFYMKNSSKKFKKMQIDAVGILLDKNNNFEIKFIENISL